MVQTHPLDATAGTAPADKYKSKCARQADELRRLQRETAEQKNRIAILTRDVNKLRDRLRAVEQYDTARIFRERRKP